MSELKKVSFYPTAFRCDDLPQFSVHYDDVVRTDDFKRVQEDMRNSDLSQDTGSSKGVYDYPDGKIPSVDTVTPVILALRSGKLDKADVQKLREHLTSEAEKEKKLSDDKALADADLALQKARQFHLDSMTGFDSSKVVAE